MNLAASAVREARELHPDDLYLYLLGTAARPCLDPPDPPNKLDYADQVAMLRAEFPAIDAQLLLSAADVTRLFSAEDVRRFTFPKVDLVTQAIRAGKLAQPTGDLGELTLFIPNADGPGTHPVRFPDCGVEDLQRLLAPPKPPPFGLGLPHSRGQ